MGFLYFFALLVFTVIFVFMRDSYFYHASIQHEPESIMHLENLVTDTRRPFPSAARHPRPL